MPLDNIYHVAGSASGGDRLKDKVAAIICAMMTPRNKDGSVMKKGVKSLVDHLIGNGVDVIFPTGTAGESLAGQAGACEERGPGPRLGLHRPRGVLGHLLREVAQDLAVLLRDAHRGPLRLVANG